MVEGRALGRGVSDRRETGIGGEEGSLIIIGHHGRPGTHHKPIIY